MKLKLNKEFKQVGSDIFWVGKVDYIDREYETLVDSKGNSHHVQVSHEMKSVIIDETNYIKERVSGYDTYKLKVGDNQFIITGGGFQHKLNDYRISYPEYKIGSMYNLVGNIINDNTKEHKYIIHHYLLNDCKYYFPIYENCFTSGNNTNIERAITDEYFFSFKNKEQAIENINYGAAEKLRKLKYTEMDDVQFLNFMKKRLDEYIKMKRLHPEIFE